MNTREQFEAWFRVVLPGNAHVSCWVVWQAATEVQATEITRLTDEVKRLREALKQVACSHERTGGGNDYLMCSECGLEWDYRKMERPTPEQIARLVLDKGRLWSCDTLPDGRHYMEAHEALKESQ